MNHRAGPAEAASLKNPGNAALSPIGTPLAIGLAWARNWSDSPTSQGTQIMTTTSETFQRTAVSLFGALVFAALFVGSAISVVPVA